MKIQCSSEKLKSVLTHVDRITAKNVTLPILSCILCIASEKKLVLRATNLSLGIEATIQAEIEEEGVFAIPGNIFTSFLSHLKTDEKISLELLQDLLIIKTKKSTVKIKTLPYEDFPIIPTIEATPITISIQSIIQGFEQVYFATAQTDIKPELASVYMYQTETALVFVATDSFRLAEKQVFIKELYGLQPLLIPNKNVIEMIRIFDGITETVELRITKNQLTLTSKEYLVSSRIIDGAFPDYKQILPKTTNSESTLLKQELLQAIKGITLFTDKFSQLTLTSNPENKKFILFAKNTDVGEQEIILDAVTSGNPVSVNINAKYLLDCLLTIPTDSVRFSFTDETKPFIVQGVGDQSFSYLVMPMNK